MRLSHGLFDSYAIVAVQDDRNPMVKMTMESAAIEHNTLRFGRLVPETYVCWMASFDDWWLAMIITERRTRNRWNVPKSRQSL